MKSKEVENKDGLRFSMLYVDTKNNFKWCIEIRKGNRTVKRSKFTTDFRGILTVTYKGKMYGVLTNFYEGVLPSEQVFEMTPYKTVVASFKEDPEKPSPKGE